MYKLHVQKLQFVEMMSTECFSLSSQICINIYVYKILIVSRNGVHKLCGAVLVLFIEEVHEEGSKELVGLQSKVSLRSSNLLCSLWKPTC